MKDRDLEEEEVCVGQIFIEEYNRLNKTDYNKPISIDTDADLVFASSTRSDDRLSVQVTQATDEGIEKQITRDLKAGGESFFTGDCPDENVILGAVRKKSGKYANKDLILIVYTHTTAALPRDYQVPPKEGVKFREIWLVEFVKRRATRIFLRGSES
ncbi:MAG: hypothetical protein HY204_06215 [Nitrospirae bacterium]|nr:hypothetical protein [Nitrospirota bacterium]